LTLIELAVVFVPQFDLQHGQIAFGKYIGPDFEQKPALVVTKS